MLYVIWPPTNRVVFVVRVSFWWSAILRHGLASKAK
jgi:hypothetical protein